MKKTVWRHIQSEKIIIRLYTYTYNTCQTAVLNVQVEFFAKSEINMHFLMPNGKE